jgi:CDP-diacylglycerol--serine O-phosphatidyltransferase
MARLANATSEFGIELDSISDVVSFGVAPGFLLYTFVLHELSIIGIILSALPPICGAIRLARFYVDSKYVNYDFYMGLPIPVQASMVSALYLTFNKRMEWFASFENGILSFIIPVVIVLSFLMVSTIPFDKIPRFDKDSIKKYKNRMIVFFLYIIIIAIFQDIGLMIVFTFFIAKGLLMGAIVFWKRAFTDDVEPLEVPI